MFLDEKELDLLIEQVKRSTGHIYREEAVEGIWAALLERHEGDKLKALVDLATSNGLALEKLGGWPEMNK